MRKLTLEYVTKQFEARGYTLLSKEYKGVDQKLDYECPEHVGQPNSIRYSDLRRGAGCRYCAQEKRDAPRRTPFSVVKKAFSDRGYILVSENYVNSQTPLLYICREHFHKDTKMTYSSIRSGNGCKYCARVGKHDIDEIREEFKKRGYLLLTKVYENTMSPLEFECEKHPGIVSKVSYSNFKSLGQGCNFCSGNLRYDLGMAKEVFKQAGYRLLATEYINSTTPMPYECPNHPDEDTVTTLKAINKGTRCAYCYLDSIQGSGHPNYNPEITDEERIRKRDYPEYSKWRNSVFERDNYRCMKCGDSQGGNLVAHHLDGYGWCIEKRTDIDNGVTLCEQCHTDFHSKYGYGNNTKSEYDEWVTIDHSEEDTA